MIAPPSRSGLLVFLVLLTCLASASFAANVSLSLRSQEPAPSAPRTQRQAQGDGSDEADATESVKARAVSGDPYEKQREDRHGTTADWWMVILTFLGFIATLWLVVIAGQQFETQTAQTNEALRHAADGLEETRRAAGAADRAEAAQAAHNEAILRHVERVAMAVKASADASVASADVARRALVLSQRAYLSIVEVDFGPWGTVAEPDFVFQLTNSGRLAATITDWGCCILVGEVLTDDRDIDSLKWLGHAGPIPPSGKHGIRLTPNFTFNHDYWKAVMSGRLSLTIWGVIRYNTGFNDVPGELGFAFEYDPNHPNGSYGKRFSLADAKHYNYAE